MEIIQTDDGSHTIYVKELDETYHSRHGAVRESLHVFIRHGLEYQAKAVKTSNITIFEVGLGTGLNALLTQAYAAESKKRINYQVLEPYPLEVEVLDKLNYGHIVKNEKAGANENGPATLD